MSDLCLPYSLSKYDKTVVKYTSIFVVEMLGVLIFHFIGSASATPWTNALCLTAMVFYCAKVSAAHLNPAVSLCFMILGYNNPFEMVLYWMAQITGALISSMLLVGVIPVLDIRGGNQLYSGCFTANELLSNSQIFAWELICTTILLLSIFSVVWHTHNKDGYGNTGPMIIGITLAACAFASSTWTGGAMNPARVIGSSVVFNCNSKMGYYILGELFAGAFASILILPWYGLNVDPWYFKTDGRAPTMNSRRFDFISTKQTTR